MHSWSMHKFHYFLIWWLKWNPFFALEFQTKLWGFFWKCGKIESLLTEAFSLHLMAKSSTRQPKQQNCSGHGIECFRRRSRAQLTTLLCQTDAVRSIDVSESKFSSGAGIKSISSDLHLTWTKTKVIRTTIVITFSSF